MARMAANAMRLRFLVIGASVCPVDRLDAAPRN